MPDVVHRQSSGGRSASANVPRHRPAANASSFISRMRTGHRTTPNSIGIRDEGMLACEKLQESFCGVALAVK